MLYKSVFVSAYLGMTAICVCEQYGLIDRVDFCSSTTPNKDCAQCVLTLRGDHIAGEQHLHRQLPWNGSPQSNGRRRAKQTHVHSEIQITLQSR